MGWRRQSLFYRLWVGGWVELTRLELVTPCLQMRIKAA
jgi:hypothetical protein